jgi:hypothetical protein
MPSRQASSSVVVAVVVVGESDVGVVVGVLGVCQE